MKYSHRLIQRGQQVLQNEANFIFSKNLSALERRNHKNIPKGSATKSSVSSITISPL